MKRTDLAPARIRWGALATVALALFGSTASAFDIAEIERNVTMSTLKNGLKVIVLERHDAPVVSLVTYANVGSADDPKGFTGMAHVFEHMAFKGDKQIGTKNYAAEAKAIDAEEQAFLAWRSARSQIGADSVKVAALEAEFRAAQKRCDSFVMTNEFGEIVEREGFVGLNAFTSWDQTCYLYNFPQNKLELAVMMEASRFSNPVLREYHKEVDVVKEERRMRSESNPIGKLLEEFLAVAYKAHPYGLPPVGHMSDLGQYSRSEALTFFQRYYAPNNLCIAVVGDVNSADVFRYVEKYFGQLPAGNQVDPIATLEPVQNGERRVVVEDPSQPVWIVGYKVPNSLDPDKPALDALVDYLGQGRTSLLYKKLVKETKKAVQVGAFTGLPGDKYPSLVAVFAIASKDVTNQDIETLVFAEVNRLQEEKLNDEEIAAIKARARNAYISQFEDRLNTALQLAQAEMVNGDWKEFFRQLDKINAVTADDIQRVARQYLTRKNRTVGYIETIES